MRIYRFHPKLAPTLATLALLPLLGQLGLWQWHKAEAKHELQQRIDALAKAPPVPLGAQPPSVNLARYRRVTVRGHYESTYQVLLDNQVQGEQAGFQVLTPLRIEDSEVRVLVNRGWVPLGRSRDDLPRIDPPVEAVTITGTVWEPTPPKWLLPAPAQPGAAWQPLWETFDLARYRTQVPFALQPFALRLDPAAAGCYTCDWPRVDEKIGMHLGYAMQWFGMAGVLVVFYGYASLKREVAHK